MQSAVCVNICVCLQVCVRMCMRVRRPAMEFYIKPVFALSALPVPCAIYSACIVKSERPIARPMSLRTAVSGTSPSHALIEFGGGIQSYSIFEGR